jgi:hypothetical protein
MSTAKPGARTGGGGAVLLAMVGARTGSTGRFRLGERRGRAEIDVVDSSWGSPGRVRECMRESGVSRKLARAQR